jgi:integrase/recombinase XerC/integrase/recombinase XerD
MEELTIRQEHLEDNNNVSVAYLLDLYEKNIDVVKETKKTYLKGINNFKTWLEGNDTKHVNKAVILAYKDYLMATYEETTARTYLSGLKNLFNFMEELGVPNVMRNVKGVKISHEFKKQSLTRDQFYKIDNYQQGNLETLKAKRDYAIFNLLSRNGLRTIELERANKEDFKQMNGRWVLMVQGKGHTSKDKPAVLFDGALIPLLDYLDARGKDDYPALFIGLATNKYGTRLTTKSIRRIIKELLVANGYKSKDLTAHSLRHTAITFSLKGGATIQQAKELARHENINTTMVYAHNIERIEDAPERFIEDYLKKGDNQDGKDNNHL